MWGARRGPAMVAALAVTFVAATAGTASATVEVTNQNDPAGDPTVVSYRLIPPTGAPIDFALHDGESKGFGPFDGQVVVQAVVPAGWRVEHIACTGFNPNGPSATANVFTIDEANGRVTMQHARTDEQFCTFTNGRATSGGGSSGVSPAPPPNAAPNLVPPKKVALLAVKVRRGYAIATVRITERSVMKSQLRWHGRVIGTSRAVRKAGTYDLTVPIRPSARRTFKRHGLKRVALLLRVVVVGSNRATHVFRFRVLVPV
jgi:hypothetical protein